MAQHAETVHYLFAYGLLMTGLRGHRYMQGSESIGPATLTSDLVMIDLGKYPGLVPASALLPDGAASSSRTTIQGELFRIPGALFRALDTYEGVPHAYQRRKLPVHLTGVDEAIDAWVYVYVGDRIHGAPIVCPPDWRGYAASRDAPQS